MSGSKQPTRTLTQQLYKQFQERLAANGGVLRPLATDTQPKPRPPASRDFGHVPSAPSMSAVLSTRRKG